MNRRRAVTTVAVMALSLALAACMGKEEGLQPTETQTTAIERVEKLIQDAVAQLPAGTTLKDDYRSNEAACDDPTDNGPAGRIIVEHRHWIVSSESFGAWKTDKVIPPLVTYWQQQGFEVRHDLRDRPDPRYTVENADGYLVSVRRYDRGASYEFTLSATSPCIWQNGTPNPQ